MGRRRRGGSVSVRRGGSGGNAGAAGCLLIALAVVALLGSCSLCKRCISESPEEKISREQLEQARAQQERAAVEAEQTRKAKAAEDARAAEQKRVADQRASFAALTPAGREKALRDACTTGTTCQKETTDLVIDAAPGDPERKKLTTLRQVLEAQLAAKEKQRQAAEQARDRPVAQPVDRSGGGGGVRCCDGTISGCATVHRGCCSHHGGVCGG